MLAFPVTFTSGLMLVHVGAYQINIQFLLKITIMQPLSILTLRSGHLELIRALAGEFDADKSDQMNNK